MLIDRGLDRLLPDKEYGFFTKLYKMTPEEFMSKYDPDYTIDLSDKIVVVMSGYQDGDTKYPLEVLGMYFPEDHHKATLTYNGHISFIDIRTKSKDERVEILYKDDECPPLDFDEFVDCAIWDDEDFPDFNGDVMFKIIECYLRGALQDPFIEVEKDKLIILQGL